MNIGIIAFTEKGLQTAGKVCENFSKTGYVCEKYVLKKDAPSKDDVTIVTEGLSKWTETAFTKYEGLIFIGATGIAVRAIAPFIKSKAEDPAVICIDEKGMFVISLLSGHIGGGNKLTVYIAEMIGATPVITTATDINGKFAVDTWAKEQNLEILNLKSIKVISSAVLENKDVYMATEFDIEGTPPDHIYILPISAFTDKIKKGEAGIFVGDYPEKRGVPLSESLMWLGTKNIILGLGCRKNIEYEKVKSLVFETLDKLDIKEYRIKAVASIDIKAEEPALIELGRELKVPFRCFEKDKLLELQGVFSHSGFVKQTVGVDSVCERAAMYMAGDGAELILKKTAKNGVTIAVAEIKPKITF